MSHRVNSKDKSGPKYVQKIRVTPSEWKASPLNMPLNGGVHPGQ